LLAEVKMQVNQWQPIGTPTN